MDGIRLQAFSLVVEKRTGITNLELQNPAIIPVI